MVPANLCSGKAKTAADAEGQPGQTKHCAGTDGADPSALGERVSELGRRLGGAADRSNVSTSDFTVEHVLTNDVCRPIAYLEPRPAGASASKWSPDNVPPVGR